MARNRRSRRRRVRERKRDRESRGDSRSNAIASLTRQARGLQSSLDSVYKKRGLSYDSTTRTARRISDGPGYIQSPEETESPTEAQQISDTITGEALRPEAPIPLTTPQQTDTTNYSSILAQIQQPEEPQAGTAGTTGAMGAGVATPQTSTGGVSYDAFARYTRYLGLRKKAPDVEQIRQDTERETGLRKYEKRVRKVSDQLKAIKSNAEANQLAVTGQGRGIPEAIIGGQQAQIAKEAAIASLPLAAELDVAQGDLQSAESKFDSLFRIRVQDAENKVNEYNQQVDSIWDFFSKQEQSKLDDVKEEKKYQLGLARDASEAASKLAFDYMSSGDSATSNAILAIRPIDINKSGDVERYKQELARYGGKTDPTIDLSSDKKRALLGAGLNQSDIFNIEKDINAEGIDSVLAGITDAKQKAAIQKAYSGDEESKLTRANVASLYSIVDDDNKTNWLGWGKTNKEKLDEIEKTIKLYRDIGYTDTEILKLIKG